MRHPDLTRWSAKEVHRAAMIHADMGYAALRRGDMALARNHFRDAYRLEMAAVGKLQGRDDAVVDMIIMLRSAASLASQALAANEDSLEVDEFLVRNRAGMGEEMSIGDRPHGPPFQPGPGRNEIQDSIRLNWMEAHPGYLRCDNGDAKRWGTGWWTIGRGPNYKRQRYETAREAIDAALAEEREG